MRRTIDRLIYNTDTAEEIAFVVGSPNTNVERVYLYRTRLGRWFHFVIRLEAEDSIIPLTEEEAYQFCEVHCLQATIDGFFSDMVEEA